jgi:PBP1b-binding outer membrane lipoprotein LpoB
MKMKLIAAIIAAFVIIMGCASNPKASKSDELDLAIRDTSDYLNDNIPKGNKIIILNIQSDYAALSDYIIDELIANAVNDKIFSVVDRAQLEQIRAELNFQWSGEVDDKSALEIGKFLGAQTIVTGAISQLADRHRMRIRALNVKTAEVQGQYNRNITASPLITALMKGGKSTNTTYSGKTASGNSGSTTGGTSGAKTQTAQPVATRQPTGMKNGTYTMWPRPRATQSGLPADMWIPQIIATNDYIVIFFSGSATGDFSGGRGSIYYSDWRDASLVQLQDLDNPSRFYKPASINSHNNGGGAIYSMSFKRFPATRFSLTCERVGFPPNNTPMSFEKIIIPNEPDAE